MTDSNNAWITAILDRSAADQERANDESEAAAEAARVFDEQVDVFWAAVREEMAAAVEKHNSDARIAGDKTRHFRYSRDANEYFGAVTVEKSYFPAAGVRCELDRPGGQVIAREWSRESREAHEHGGQSSWRFVVNGRDISVEGNSPPSVAQMILEPVFRAGTPRY
jgi:hypothetical protein